MEGEVKECSKGRRIEGGGAEGCKSILNCFFFLANSFTEGKDEMLLIFFPEICFTLFFFLFTSPRLHFQSNSHPHNHINTHSFALSQDAQRETYLALATSSVSVKRKRCLSWVCRPVFSCAWA